jgi:hypothetical protein
VEVGRAYIYKGRGGREGVSSKPVVAGRVKLGDLSRTEEEIDQEKDKRCGEDVEVGKKEVEVDKAEEEVGE